MNRKLFARFVLAALVVGVVVLLAAVAPFILPGIGLVVGGAVAVFVFAKLIEWAFRG